jgi:tetratricopeptide (TPR) repeat protein
LQIEPSSARVRYDLGAVLLGTGERELARAQFQAVNDINPGDPQALVALAIMALEDEQPEQAIALLRSALERRPGFQLALTNLAATYEIVGDFAQALASYEKAFAAGPPTPEAACAAAWILATGPGEELLDGPHAVELALFAVQRQAENALEVLAAAYARAGDFEKAVEVQLEAIQRARAPERKRELEERLELYRAGTPFTRTR